MLKLRDYQLKIRQDIFNSIRSGHKNIVLVAGTGAGKCLGYGTPVLMYDGAIKTVEQVQIGDRLMGDDSTPRTVLSLARGQEELYRITPIKGDSWVCNQSHILSLVSNASKSGLVKDQIYDLPLSDYLSSLKSVKHILKQYRVPVLEFGYGTDQELPIDPWLLGLFIGDGHKKLGSFHLNDLNKVPVAERASELFVKAGYKPSSQRDSSLHGVRFFARKDTCEDSFIKKIRVLYGTNLTAKNVHIPQDYKTSTFANRLSILAGIIDADGGYGHHLEISTVSQTLCNDICFIARSVGLAAYPVQRVTKCEGKSFDSYRINISGDLSIIPSARFDFQPRKQIKSVLRTGFTIEPIGVGDYYGFTIDGNRRFLLGDFTVTHNTECACALAQDSKEKGRQVYFMVHRDNLVRQTVARFQKYSLNPGVIKSGFKADLTQPVQVCSLQSLARRPEAIKHLNNTKSLLMWDESHITAFSTLGRALIGAQNPNHINLALTATPWRLKKTESFGDLFTDMVMAPLPHELIGMGFLVPLRYFGLPYIDTKGVGTRGGDFAQDQLSLVTSDPAVVQDAVSNWIRLGENRRTIAFTVDVNHSLALANEFNRQGINAAAVHGEMDPVKEREPIYQRLATGEITVVVSCEALAEGFDCPAVGCVLLCRPTKSRAKYLQQMGRGMRISSETGKVDCLVLDQAGNVERLGFVEDLRAEDFTLHPSEEAGDGQPPVKQCQNCGALVHISKKVCPHCAYPFPIIERERATGSLVELVKGYTPEKRWNTAAQTYRELRQLAYRKKISPGYAAIKYSEWQKEMQGQGKHYQPYPSANWSLGAVFGTTPTEANRKHYLNYLRRIANSDRNPKDEAWVQREFEREFGAGSIQQQLAVS